MKRKNELKMKRLSKRLASKKGRAAYNDQPILEMQQLEYDKELAEDSQAYNNPPTWQSADAGAKNHAQFVFCGSLPRR